MSKKNEIRCPDCDCLLKQKDFNKGVCWKCDTSIINLKKKLEQEEKKREKEEADSVERQNPKSVASSKSKYYALQIISIILNVIGWISIILGVFWFFYAYSLGYVDGFRAVLYIVIPVLTGIINIALSQFINLFIDIANDVNKIKNQKG